MVNFMCQLDRAMRCSDSWSNIILGVFKRKFLDQTNIKISGQSKADCSPLCGRPHPIS